MSFLNKMCAYFYIFVFVNFLPFLSHTIYMQDVLWWLPLQLTPKFHNIEMGSKEIGECVLWTWSFGCRNCRNFVLPSSGKWVNVFIALWLHYVSWKYTYVYKHIKYKYGKAYCSRHCYMFSSSPPFLFGGIANYVCCTSYYRSQREMTDVPLCFLWMPWEPGSREQPFSSFCPWL